MPNVARARASRLAAAGLALGLVATLSVPAAPALAHDPPRTPPRPPGLRAFMEALGSVESNGRYDARNRTSGAYGKYQIMPSNWPSWSHIYLGRHRAKPTPANQERVAAGRLSDLYRGLDRWDRVAYWWLTGNRGPRSGWSDYASRYVGKVIGRFRVALATPPPGVRRHVFGDRSQAVVYRGTWSSVRNARYTGDHAHVATRRGASLVIRFTGRSIQLVGPMGPKRGRAAILVDGRRVRTIDLHAARPQARRVLVGIEFDRRGTHRVELRVLGTKGRPSVVLDRVVVRR